MPSHRPGQGDAGAQPLSGRLRVAVIGPSDATEDQLAAAERVGSLLGGRGAVLLCGGLGGVMEGAARGCRSAGGTTVGILPGLEESDANAFIDLPIVTGLGEGRNLILIRSCHAAIAIGGGYGTLSELAFALRWGVPVVGIETWRFAFPSGPHSGLHYRESPEEAVRTALDLAARTRARHQIA